MKLETRAVMKPNTHIVSSIKWACNENYITVTSSCSQLQFQSSMKFVATRLQLLNIGLFDLIKWKISVVLTYLRLLGRQQNKSYSMQGWRQERCYRCLAPVDFSKRHFYARSFLKLSEFDSISWGKSILFGTCTF